MEKNCISLKEIRTGKVIFVIMESITETEEKLRKEDSQRTSFSPLSKFFGLLKEIYFFINVYL